MQPWAANLDSNIAEPVCPPGPLLGMMNLNWGTIAPYSACVGPRRGGMVLPSLLPLFKGNYLFSSSLLHQLAALLMSLTRYFVRRSFFDLSFLCG